MADGKSIELNGLTGHPSSELIYSIDQIGSGTVILALKLRQRLSKSRFVHDNSVAFGRHAKPSEDAVCILLMYTRPRPISSSDCDGALATQNCSLAQAL
jgi:hypothetical protein